MNSQEPSLLCRPPSDPSGCRNTQQVLLHPWALPPAHDHQPYGAEPPSSCHPLVKVTMGLGCIREGVIPAWGKNFIRPLAEGTYCPRQKGTLCKNPKAPSDTLAFPGPPAGHPA